MAIKESYIKIKCGGCGDELHLKASQDHVTCRKCGKVMYRNAISGTDRKNNQKR